MKTNKSNNKEIIPREVILQKIYFIKGQRVMIDNDLALLYGVNTKVLNQAVKRNHKRFPSDFMFTLTKKDMHDLRSQNVTSSHGGRRYLPHVFTEQGIAMLSSVINSERAIYINIQIIRTFVHMRKIITQNKNIQKKINILEQKLTKRIDSQKNIYDKQFKIVFQAFEEIKRIITPPNKPKRRIGFHAD